MNEWRGGNTGVSVSESQTKQTSTCSRLLTQHFVLVLIFPLVQMLFHLLLISPGK